MPDLINKPSINTDLTAKQLEIQNRFKKILDTRSKTINDLKIDIHLKQQGIALNH